MEARSSTLPEITALWKLRNHLRGHPPPPLVGEAAIFYPQFPLQLVSVGKKLPSNMAACPSHFQISTEGGSSGLIYINQSLTTKFWGEPISHRFIIKQWGSFQTQKVSKRAAGEKMEQWGRKPNTWGSQPLHPSAGCGNESGAASTLSAHVASDSKATEGLKGSHDIPKTHLLSFIISLWEVMTQAG